ncbi:MAG: autotransporter domain-containing protein [Puniceicoccales bacterium]|nr:autotransporter domain-containing protein [Puniceicoccales bacterium]
MSPSPLSGKLRRTHFAKTALLAAAALAATAAAPDAAAVATTWNITDGVPNLYWYGNGVFSTGSNAGATSYPWTDGAQVDVSISTATTLYLQSTILLSDEGGASITTAGGDYVFTAGKAPAIRFDSVAAGSLNFATNGDGAAAGAIAANRLTGAGTINWDVSGGRLNFTAASNSTFTGNILVNRGIVSMGTAATGGNNTLLGSTAAAKVYINSDAEFTIVAPAGASTNYWSAHADNKIANTLFSNNGTISLVRGSTYNNTVELTGELTHTGITTLVSNNTADSGLIFSGKITGADAGAVLTIGANGNGTAFVVFTNSTNDYAGETVLNGWLSLHGDGVLPATTAVTINGTGGLRFDKSGTTPFLVPQTIAGAGTFQVASGTVRVSQNNTTFTGSIRVGADAPAYTGAADAPVLEIGDGTFATAAAWFAPFSVATASVSLASTDATLSFNLSDTDGDTTGKVTARITGNGSVAKRGDGVITLTNANNSYAGTTDIYQGKLALSATGKIGTGGVRLGGTGIFDISATSGYTLASLGSLTNGPDIGTNAKIELGNKLLTLTGSGLYSGQFSSDTTANSRVTYTAANPDDTLTLGGALGHRGTTAVTAGVLVISNHLDASYNKTTTLSLTGSGSATITDGTGLDFSNAETAILLNTTGTLTVAGGASLHAKNLTALSGTIRIDSSDAPIFQLGTSSLLSDPLDGRILDAAGATGVTLQGNNTTTAVFKANALGNWTGTAIAGFTRSTIVLDSATLDIAFTAAIGGETGQNHDVAKLSLINGAIAQIGTSAVGGSLYLDVRQNTSGGATQWGGGIAWRGGSSVVVNGTAHIIRGVLSGDGTGSLKANVISFESTGSDPRAVRLENVRLEAPVGGRIEVSSLTQLTIAKASGQANIPAAVLAVSSSGTSEITINSGATLVFDLTNSTPFTSLNDADSAAATSALLRLIGAKFNGTSLANVKFDITGFSPALTGYYTIFDASGINDLANTNGLALPTDIKLNGSVASDFFVRSSGNATQASLSRNAENTRIYLAIAASNANTVVTWKGTGAAWKNDDGTTDAPNWGGSIAGTPIVTFLDGDTAEFNDTAATSRNVVIDEGGVAPARVRVTTNATTSNAYVFSGGPVKDAPTALAPNGTTLEKDGYGKLTLTAPNQYTGGTTIRNGDLAITDLGALGSGGVTFLSGGRLELNIAATAAGEFANKITGPGAIIKIGDGAVTLKPATGSAYIGSVTLNASTSIPHVEGGDWNRLTLDAADVGGELGFSSLTLGSNTELVVASDTSLLVAGNISLAAGSWLSTGVNAVVSAEGKITFAGSGNNRPVLRIEAATSGVVIARANEIDAPNGFRVFFGDEEQPSAISTEVFVNRDVRIVTSADFEWQELQVRDSLAWNNTGQGLQHGVFTLPAPEVGDTYTVAEPLANNPLVNGPGFVIGTNDDGTDQYWDGKTLIKRGTGRLILEQPSTYTGETRVEEGFLELRSPAAAGEGNAAIRINTGASLVFNIAPAATGAQPASLQKPLADNGHVVKTGTGELVFALPNTEFVGDITVAEGVLTLADPAAAGGTNSVPHITIEALGTLRVLTPRYTSWEFGKNILGAGAFEKSGDGDLVLTGSNSYGGTTSVAGGRLLVKDRASLGTGSLVTVAAGAVVVLSVPTAATGDAAWDWEKELIGEGKLAKDGGGELILSRPAAYTGGTEISNGTLILQDAAATGEVTGGLRPRVTLASSATLTLDFQDADGTPVSAEYDAAISGSGTLHKKGAGAVVTLTGDNPAFTGKVVVNDGTLALRTPGAAGTGAIELAAATATVRLETQSIDDTWVFTTHISGTGSLEKIGTGLLTLSADNNYGGETRVAAGALVVTGSLRDPGQTATTSAVYSGKITIAAAGATFELEQTGSYTQTLSGGTAGAGTFVKSGAENSTAILAGANAHTGATIVNTGRLILAGSLGTTYGGTGSFRYGGDIEVAEGAVFELNRSSGKQTLAGSLTGSGTLVKRGTDTLVLTGLVAAPVQIQTGSLQIGATHGNANGLPETLRSTSITISGGATLLFDIYGGSLADKLSTANFAYDNPDAPITIDLSVIANGTYELLTVGAAAGFGAVFDAHSSLRTLLAGQPLPEGSTTYIRYDYSADGKTLLLLVSGNEHGAGSEVTQNVSLDWVFAPAQDGAPRQGTWDTLSEVWKETAKNEAPRLFRHGDIVNFNTDGANSGIIEVAGAMRVSAMRVSGAGELVLANGAINGGAQQKLTGGDGSLTKSGKGRLVFRGGSETFEAAFAGGVLLSEGTIALEKANLSAPLASAGIRIETAAQIFLGSPASGEVAATQGGLSAVGGIVNNGDIYGNGVISGNFINNGNLSPGFSAGKITLQPGVGGTFTNNGRITLEVFGDGTHDTLSYSSAADILIGGSLLLDVADKYIQDNYRDGKVTLPALLETLSSGTVAFDTTETGAVTILFTNSTLAGRVVDAQQGVIELWQSFQNINGLKPALSDFAALLTELSQAGNEETGVLCKAIYDAADNSSAAAAKIIEQASPIAFSAILAMPIQNAQVATDALRGHLASRREATRSPKFTEEIGKGDAYFFANGAFTDNKSASDSPVFDTETFGATVGTDVWFSDYFLAGINVGGNTGKSKIHDNGGRIRQEEFRLTAYSTIRFTNWLAADVSVFSGLSKFDTRRITAIAPDALGGKTDSTLFGASLNFAGNFELAKSGTHTWTLAPFIGADYATTSADAFSEHYENDRGALSVQKFDADSLRLKVGAGVVWQWAGAVPLRLRLNVAYAHELLDTDADIVARFAGDSGWGRRFSTNSVYASEGVLELSPSLEIELSRHASFGIGYSFDTDFDNRTAHRFNAAIHIKW